MPSGGDDPLSKEPDDSHSDQSEDDEDEDALEIDEADLDSFLREHNALDEYGQVIDSNVVTKVQEQSHVAMAMDMDIIAQLTESSNSHGEARHLLSSEHMLQADSTTSLSTQTHTLSSPSAIANGNSTYLPTAAMIPLLQDPFLLQDAEDWMAAKQREIEQQEILLRNISTTSMQSVQAPPVALHLPTPQTAQSAPSAPSISSVLSVLSVPSAPASSSFRHIPRPALPHTSLSYVEPTPSPQSAPDEEAKVVEGGDMDVDVEVGIQQEQQHQHRQEEQTPRVQLQVPLAGPVPSSVTPEEMELLKAEIRAQTQHALEENRKFQETITRHLAIDEFRALIAKQEKAQSNPVLLHNSDKGVGPPYFVDINNEVPPDNEDAEMRKKRALGLSNRESCWGQRERDQLREGVIAENKRIMFEMLSKTKNPATIKFMEEEVPNSEMTINTKGLNWQRISDRYVPRRSATQCLIQWTGHDHPGINNGIWRKKEVALLEELVEKYQGRNWIQIAVDLNTNRTASMCFRRYQSRQGKTITRGHWTEEENNILREAVRVLGDNNWSQVSYCLDNRSATQCHQHWTKSACSTIRRVRWLPEEDSALRKAVEVYGTGKWAKVQHHVPGRTDIQCRERYVNVLAPNIRFGSWTKEESEKLMHLVDLHGAGKWSLIASHMDGRTDNQCVRRWQLVKREQEKKELGLPVKEFIRRRPGRTTAAALPDAKEHKDTIREVTQMNRPDKFALKKFEKQYTDARRREATRQYYQDLEYLKGQIDYNMHLHRQRDIYDRWMDRWGEHHKPIEQVFNLGIPPNYRKPSTDPSPSQQQQLSESQSHIPSERQSSRQPSPVPQSPSQAQQPSLEPPEEGKKKATTRKERKNRADGLGPAIPGMTKYMMMHLAKQRRRAQVESMDELSLFRETPPESSARPGMVRPVPPSVATVEALSQLVMQGAYDGGRFMFPHVCKDGKVETPQLHSTPLTDAERSRPEYRELSERFESVFMWPTMLGMLHMAHAREQVTKMAERKRKSQRDQETRVRTRQNLERWQALMADGGEGPGVEPPRISVSPSLSSSHPGRKRHRSRGMSLGTSDNNSDSFVEDDMDSDDSDRDDDEPESGGVGHMSAKRVRTEEPERQEQEPESMDIHKGPPLGQKTTALESGSGEATGTNDVLAASKASETSEARSSMLVPPVVQDGSETETDSDVEMLNLSQTGDRARQKAKGKAKAL
ncbi:Myblike DNAbinding domain-containing protein [Podila minutissima]|uniref:Myblike DNAbinding domain-containing protein n=1 Tax=Podila minutissima TaxID=64525 RepID=A0A9P5SCE1_9FUNG|nr:Myblike DNAbinding domain-containing protein [Podila minutissima]